jgi:cytochrome c oxidase subunit 4
MDKANLTQEDELQIESHAPYMKVFFSLAVLTALEYFYARWFKDSFGALVLGLMFLAIVKAGLVGWFFMHLKFEGKWVYGMLVPASILAMVLTFGLMPDVGLQPVTEEGPEEEESESVYNEPSATPRLVIPGADSAPSLTRLRA